MTRQPGGHAQAVVDLLRTTFPPERASVPVARHAVTGPLREHGLDGLADETALLTSEVVTNAVRHARTPFGLCLDWNGRRVRMEVEDHSPEPPRPREQPVSDPGGVGLALVDAIASRWGFQREYGDGKVVWFELDAD